MNADLGRSMSRRWTITLAAVACVLTSALAWADDATPLFSKGRHFDERSGEALYRSICQGCHQSQGQGAQGAGNYPALAHDANLASRQYPVVVLLMGRKNMPSFAQSLDDAQIAAVATYVRSHFGNDYADEITAAEVAALRPAK